MDEGLILPTGVFLTPLNRIPNVKGDIYHCLKKTDTGFSGFGEAYFTTVHQGVTKGWKQHQLVTMNLVVPVGEVEFFLRDPLGGLGYSVRLGEGNYQRLTVSPGLWMAFRGIAQELNLVLNLANMPHDPDEAINVPLETFSL